MAESGIRVNYEIEGNKILLTPSIVKEYIVGNKDVEITNAEFKMFAELCQVRKLNPFLKEAYLIKYSNNQTAQLVVGKDAILKRAILNKEFNGRKQGVIVVSEDGVNFREGTFKLPEEQLVGGWAEVYRKDWDHPVKITVSFEEVAQRKSNGELNSNWASKGATMVEKVALVRALREAFAEDVGGMVDEHEAWDLKEEKKPRHAVEEATVVKDENSVDIENL